MQILDIHIRQLCLYEIRVILFSYLYINQNRQLKKKEEGKEKPNGTSVVNQRARQKYYSRCDKISVSAKEKNLYCHEIYV